MELVLNSDTMQEMLERYNLNKRKLLIYAIIFLVAVVLPITILQVQKQQETRSRASSQDVYNALKVTDKTGKPLNYKDETGIRTYETESPDVKIRVSDLEKLVGD